MNDQPISAPGSSEQQQPLSSPQSAPTQPATPSSNETPTIKHAHKFIYGYLALIVLAAIVAGVYAWQHNKVISLEKQVTVLTAQTASLQKQITSLQKSANTTVSKSSVPTTTTQPSANYFTISQWGVRAPYSGTLTLQYSESSTDVSTMYLSSAQLAAGGPAVCTYTANGEAGLLDRYLPTDLISANGVPANETAQQYVSQNSTTPYAKVGNYIYIYWGNSYLKNGLYTAPCNDKTAAIQTISAFSSIIPKLQTIQ